MGGRGVQSRTGDGLCLLIAEGRRDGSLRLGKVRGRNSAAEMSWISQSPLKNYLSVRPCCTFWGFYLNVQADMYHLVGSQRGSGQRVKESTFPLCYIFNKAKHAGNYFPFNSHISFQNDPFTRTAAILSFCTFLFTHYRKHTHSNAGHMPDFSAAVPFSLSVMWFW